MGREVGGFTIVELIIVVTVLIIMSTVAVDALIRERNAYTEVANIGELKLLITKARFDAVKSSSAYGVSLSPGKVSVVKKSNGSISVLESQIVSPPFTYYVNGVKKADIVIFFNPYGVPFGNGSPVDNLTVCGGIGRCVTVRYVVGM